MFKFRRFFFAIRCWLLHEREWGELEEYEDGWFKRCCKKCKRVWLGK